MEYEGGTWMGYDRCFRQLVAARITTEHIPFFHDDFKKLVPKHVPHIVQSIARSLNYNYIGTA